MRRRRREGFHEPDEVSAGAAHDLDDAAAPSYGDDDDVEMEDVVGGGDGVEAPPRERPVPPAFCRLAEAFADARRRLSADGLLYAKDTAIYVQYLGLDEGRPSRRERRSPWAFESTCIG